MLKLPCGASNGSGCFGLLVAVGLSLSSGELFAAERETMHPADTGAALVNPDRGWVLHYYDNSLSNYGSKLASSDTVDDLPGLSVVYLRLAWSYLEPEEGRFDWSMVDGPAQRWIAKGKKVAFRFTASEGSPAYATPEWVAKAGAKGHRFRGGKGIDETGPAWEPDFEDPVFLEKLDHFLAAAAARYDGDPSVAFIDVGSFGIWGEGHTYWSTKLPYSTAAIRKHVDLHLKHFHHTLLAANDDFASHGRGRESVLDALERGLTLRDDSILVEAGEAAYHSAALAQGVWQKRPVILESEHYGPSKRRGCWGDGSKYLEAVEAYHASYASIHWWPREFLAENRELVDRINRRLGYRLQITKASWPKQITVGQSANLSYSVRNAGVAPCYPGGHTAFTLKGTDGGIGAVFTDEQFDVRSLAPAAPDQAKPTERQLSVVIPANLKPGLYSLHVSVGTRVGTPAIALPLESEDGQHRYRLGQLHLVEP
jgi:hypothetical protein